MTDSDQLTPAEKDFLVEVLANMVVHKKAHAMWGQPVADAEDPVTPCAACGLTWQRQAASMKRGVYVCAYSQTLRGYLEPPDETQ